MPPIHPELAHTRRHFFRDCGVGLGSMALASLLERDPRRRTQTPNRAARAARVRTSPPKPRRSSFCSWPADRASWNCSIRSPNCNDSTARSARIVHQGQALRLLRSPDAKLLGSGASSADTANRAWTLSELLPYHREIVDDICFLRGMKTDVFNHGPAKVLHQHRLAAVRPAEHGLLDHLRHRQRVAEPAGLRRAAIRPRGPRGGASLWSSGFLPTRLQGVPFLKGAEPILDLANAARHRLRSSRASSSTPCAI